MADAKKVEKPVGVRINVGATQTERGPVGKFVDLDKAPRAVSDFPAGTVLLIVDRPRAAVGKGIVGVITVDGQKFYVADDRKAAPAGK